MAKAKKERAALLCRVSTPQQTEKGLESQVACLKAKAIEDGYEVPTNLIFQEQISGLDRNKEIRQSLKELMDAAEKNLVDVVYVYELTRISRDPYNLTSLIQWFSDRGIPMFIYEVELWTLDRETKQELTETTEYIFGAATFGQKEAEKIRKRMMRGKNAAAEQGFFTGHLADGYITKSAGKHKTIIPDLNRKKVIEDIYDLFLGGKSTNEIAQWLNANRVMTSTQYRLTNPQHFNYNKELSRGGTEWQGSMVAQILRNEWYKGVRRFKGKTYKIEDPIITEEKWQRVQLLREKQRPLFQSHPGKHFFLLSGFLYCSRCQKKLYGHFTSLNNHYYCSSVEGGEGCGLKGICKENCEAIVVDLLKRRSINDTYAKDDEQRFSTFFKMSDDEKKQIKEDIRTLTADNKRLQGKIDQANKRISLYFKEKADHEDLADVLETNIRTEQQDKKKYDELIITNDSRINLLSKRLNAAEKNIDKIVSTIEHETNVRFWRSLIEQVVERIELYDVDVSVSLVKIIYTNEKADMFIYSPRLMPHRYILLTHEFCTDYKIEFDGKQNIVFGEGSNLILANIKQCGNVLSQGKIGDYEFGEGIRKEDVNIIGELQGSVSVRDYCLLLRQDNPFLRTYDRTPFEVNEPRARKQKEMARQYQINRNSGLPTTLPSVVADEAYEDYLKKRKHLYNRKWKIQKNKSLNEKEKRQRLEEIDLQLQILKSRVKHLSREEQIKIYLSKKKHESK